MRSNVLQTLLLAFIMIVGWTLFTIYQDLTSTPGSVNHRTFLQYSAPSEPIFPRMESQSSMNRLPVYKRPTGRSSGQRNSTMYRGNTSLFSSSTFGQSQAMAITGPVVLLEQNFYGNNNRSRANAQQAYPLLGMQPLTLRRNDGMTALLDRNTDKKETDGATLSLIGQDTRFKVFGPRDDDDFEQGGGNENPQAYNDVSVGEGLYFLLFLIVFYAVLLLLNKKLVRND